VADLLEPRGLLRALRDAFVAHSTGRTVEAMRIPVPLPTTEAAAGASGMLLAPGLVPGIPAYSVKVHAKFPGQEPAMRGVLVLHDLASGAPLALIESSYLTALRTGVAGALGAEALCVPEARTVAIIGAGAQGRLQLAALRLVRPIDAVRVFDTDTGAAPRFASDPGCSGLRVAVTASLEEVLDGADVIVTATWAREPFLFKRHLRPGTHITALGADQPGKCEVASARPYRAARTPRPRRRGDRIMRRREFVGLLGGALAWPFAARAQQPTLPVIGYLSSTSHGPYAPFVAAFQQGLKETGFVAGQNVTIEYRWAEGQFDRLTELAADLVRRQVAIIAVGGGGVTALAAKDATSTIPIVFAFGSDPVKLGLVASLNRPGGNITGVSYLAVALGPKRLELLHEMMPKADAIGFLINPGSPNTAFDLRDVEAAARTLGQQLVIVKASNDLEIGTAFETLKQQRADALVIQADPFLFSRRSHLAALALRGKMPTIYFERDFAAAGGLLSYGTDFVDANRQAGIYAGRILKGAKPADMPVLQPTRFELVINLKTAQALGLTVPPSLLARADEVIE